MAAHGSGAALMAARHLPPAVDVLLFTLALLAWCLPAMNDMASLVFKGLLACTALGLVLLAYRRWLPPLQPDWRWLLLLIVSLYALFYLFYTSGGVSGQLGIYPLKHVLALQLTLIVMIVLQWYCLPGEHFNWRLFSVGFLLLSAGIMPPLAVFKGLYIWLVLSFIGLLSLAGIWPQLQQAAQVSVAIRRKYLLRLSLVLGCSSLLGLGGVYLFETVDRQINTLLSHFFMRQPTDWSGFSGQTRLKGGQTVQLSERVALQIQSPESLGYWRGNILTFYREGDWYPEETLNRADGEVDLRRDDHSGLWMRPYRLDAQQLATEHFALQVHSQNHYNGILFAPGEARVLLAPEEARIYRNQYGLLRRELFQPAHSYEILASRTAEIPANFNAEMLKENLRIDSDIAALLSPLARAVTLKGQTPLEKARLLENWFQQNFRYSLESAPVTPGMDPTVDFVLNRKPAWCSWFASGMVLMLRSLDIPAHLVSGWREMEYNPLGQYWVIREKSAHDWVEVLDTERNVWVRFDPTPADQLAQLQRSTLPVWLRQVYEATQTYVQRWRERLSRMNMTERRQWLQTLLWKGLSHPLMGLCLLLVAGLLYYRRRRTDAPRTDLPALSLAYRGEHPLVSETLVLLQAWLAERGLPWPEQAFDDWLQLYAAQLDVSEQEQLRALWQALEVVRFGPPDPVQAQVLRDVSQLFSDEKAQRPSA
ncbi:MAG: hypothetical protein IGS03_10840 [Candidatus Sericytochromatia bacterium]|nr:hypothetical protein [Candidatus Sericytochromatia bacterium]